MFEGNPKEVEAFLLVCRLRFSLQPSKFAKEEKKVLFATTFLNSSPKAWIQPSANEFLAGDTTISEFTSFETFTKSLRALYGDPNLEHNAMTALKSLKQTSSVAEYISRFVGYSQHTKLNDPGLREYFYDGLKDMIKDELATRRYDTLKELQETATHLNARLHERKMERNYATRLVVGKPPAWSSPSMPARAAPIAMTRPSPAPAPIPAADGTTPMELDSQRGGMTVARKEEYKRLGLCFHCGDHGYVSARCPKKVRITGSEMEVQLSENDGAQE